MENISSNWIGIVARCIADFAVAASAIFVSGALGISHHVWAASIFIFVAIVGVEIFGTVVKFQESALVSCFITILAVVLAWMAVWSLSYVVQNNVFQSIMMPFMALMMGLGRYLNPLPTQRTIRGLRSVVDVVHYELAIWSIMIVDSLSYTLASAVSLAVLILLFGVATLNGRSTQQLVMIVACLIFRLHCDAMGYQYSAHVGGLDTPVTSIVGRDDEEDKPGSQGR